MKTTLSTHQFSVSVEGKPVVQQVDLELMPGQVHAVMGPNGSGKSSLAYALAGHPAYAITGGIAAVFGQDITDLTPDKRARLGLFLAPQHSLEVPGVTVRMFLHEAYRALTGKDPITPEFQALCADAFARVGLNAATFADRGLHEGFSGGERKRLEVAQVLLFAPKLVILDEIDSGLDVDAVKQVAQALNHFMQYHPDSSLLIITHYERILQFVRPSVVHIMCAGKIVQSGDATLAQTVEQEGYDGYLNR